MTQFCRDARVEYDGEPKAYSSPRVISMTDAEFEGFVREQSARALSIALSFLKDKEEARDAVQESFVKAYRARASHRGEASLSTWFHRLLVNHLKDRLRRRAVRDALMLKPLWGGGDDEADPVEQAADPRQDPSREAESRALGRDLRKALEGLPGRQREVCRLHLVGGLTLAETASALGITEGAVKAHYFRAVQKLRHVLAPWRDAGTPGAGKPAIGGRP